MEVEERDGWGRWKDMLMEEMLRGVPRDDSVPETISVPVHR